MIIKAEEAVRARKEALDEVKVKNFLESINKAIRSWINGNYSTIDVWADPRVSFSETEKSRIFEEVRKAGWRVMSFTTDGNGRWIIMLGPPFEEKPK